MASEPEFPAEYRRSLIKSMERNLSLLYETCDKTDGNGGCPVLKKAQPMITNALCSETEAYYSLRKSFMFEEFGEYNLAGNAFESAKLALEKSDKTTEELGNMMRTECPQKNHSGFCVTQLLAKPKETAVPSIYPVFDAGKLI